MAEPCGEILSVALDCEWSNQATMIVEIMLAMIFGTIIAATFYFREKKSKDKSDKLIKSTKQTIDEQKKMLERMEPIIQKQGEEIKKQEEKNKIQYENDIDQIRYWFRLAKQDLFSTKLVFKEIRDVSEAIRMLKSYIAGTQISSDQIQKTFERILEHLKLEEIKKIDEAQAGIRMFISAIKDLDERNYLDIKQTFPLDDYIKRIEDLHDLLPDTRPVA